MEPLLYLSPFKIKKPVNLGIVELTPLKLGKAGAELHRWCHPFKGYRLFSCDMLIKYFQGGGDRTPLMFNVRHPDDDWCQ